MSLLRGVCLGVAALALVACGSGESGPERILVAEATGNGLVVRDAETDEVLYDASEPDSLTVIPRFSPDGSHVVHFYLPAESDDTFLASIDLESGERYLSPGLPWELWANPTWSPDGTRVAVGSRALAILDPQMALLSELPETDPEDLGGGQRRELPWSPDSRYVAILVESEELVIADRDGDVFAVDAMALAEPSPAGVSFDPLRDVIQGVEWHDHETIRVLIGRNLRLPRPGDRDDVHYEEARGTVGQGSIEWEASTSGSPEEWFETEGFDADEWTELRERAMSLVPGSDATFRTELMRSADGSVPAVFVPYGETVDGREPDTAKLVILVDEPVFVEFGEAATAFLRPAAVGLDVVVIPGE